VLLDIPAHELLPQLGSAEGPVDEGGRLLLVENVILLPLLDNVLLEIIILRFDSRSVISVLLLVLKDRVKSLI